MRRPWRRIGGPTPSSYPNKKMCLLRGFDAP